MLRCMATKTSPTGTGQKSTNGQSRAADSWIFSSSAVVLQYDIPQALTPTFRLSAFVRHSQIRSQRLSQMSSNMFGNVEIDRFSLSNGILKGQHMTDQALILFAMYETHSRKSYTIYSPLSSFNAPFSRLAALFKVSVIRDELHATLSSPASLTST